MFLEIDKINCHININENKLSKTIITVKRYSNFSFNGSPLFVGREKSIKSFQEVMKSDKSIVLVTQKNSEIDDPEEVKIFISLVV